jgi:hypothetical protein
MSTIALTLGHPENTTDPTLGPHAQSKAQAILSQLAEIDQQLEEARRDGMAKIVDGMQVDFAVQKNMLIAEGSRLLRALSVVSGLPLVYDSYLGVRLTAPSFTRPLMVLG